MRSRLIVMCLLAASCALSAQGPTASATSKPEAGGAASSKDSVTFTSDAGFSYSYPADWDVIDAKPMMPAIQMQAKDKADSDMERRGAECTQINLLLKHPSLQSSIIVLALPYSCVGSAMKQSDLAGAASGIAEGIKKNYDIKDPAYAAYKLGQISFSAQRSQATSKTHPDSTLTLEITCGMLSKAMVCWMAFAKDDAAISVLESGLTSLEGAPALPLVPSTAFARKEN